MSNFKTMKIRVNDDNRDAVKKALMAEGYEPNGDMHKKEIFDEANGYYTYGGDYVLCSTEVSKLSYFDGHSNPEYVLTPQGTLMPAAEYYKQPTTPAKLPGYCTGCSPLTCPSGGQCDATAEKTYEPLPEALFISREEHEKARIDYLSKCIVKTLESGNKVPREWFEELYALYVSREGK